MAGVFVNYRVNDQSLAAASLARELVHQFGEDLVFFDIWSMPPGTEYPGEMRRALESADVLVAVVGPQWMQIDPATGRSRLEDERDWVRLEIARSLERGIPVLPVLLPGARRPVHSELPESIRAFASRQVTHLSRRRLPDEMAELVEHLVDLVPTLAAPRLFTQPPVSWSPQEPPSGLLRPERRVVPYTGREGELSDLVVWATGPAQRSVKLLVGPSGSGRRRLAVELCRRLGDVGWLAGVVSGEAPAEQILRTGAVARPLLAVVDDAELRPDRLRAVADAVARRADRSSTRLLVLCRSDGAWLKEVLADDGVAALFTAADRPLVLHPVPPEPVFTAAVKAFAAELGVTTTVPRVPEATSVLELHAHALNHVLGRSASPHGPLAALHEQDLARWRELLTAEEDPEHDLAALGVVGALAALCAPASVDEAEALLARLPALLDEDPESARRHADLWSRLHPGPHLLAPPRPAALAERLVADVLVERPNLAAKLVTGLPDGWLGTALTVLGRALPHHEGLRDPVTSLFDAAGPSVAPLVVTVTDRLTDPEPLNRAFAVEIGKRHLSLLDLFDTAKGIAGAGEAHAPLRGALMDAMPAAARAFTEQLRPADAAPDVPGLEPLTTILDNLTNLARDVVVGLVDPQSGRMPTKPDGEAVLSDQTADVLRELLRRWREEDGGTGPR